MLELFDAGHEAVVDHVPGCQAAAVMASRFYALISFSVWSASHKKHFLLFNGPHCITTTLTLTTAHLADAPVYKRIETEMKRLRHKTRSNGLRCCQ